MRSIYCIVLAGLSFWLPGCNAPPTAPPAVPSGADAAVKPPADAGAAPRPDAAIKQPIDAGAAPRPDAAVKPPIDAGAAPKAPKFKIEHLKEIDHLRIRDAARAVENAQLRATMKARETVRPFEEALEAIRADIWKRYGFGKDDKIDVTSGDVQRKVGP